jgi:fermentation-respiration switch protein FrsA (DUF1100 family)
MIHGGSDTYIKKEMAESLHKRAKSGTAELWVVDNAKHNQALHVAGDEYHRKLIEFFDTHLAGVGPGQANAESAPVDSRSRRSLTV